MHYKLIMQIWNHATRYELSVAPEEHPVLLTEAPLNPKANREKMAEELFEDGIGHLQIANQAVLSLYSTGKINGVVLDCGDGSTRAVPVYDGYAVKDASHVVDLAGIDLTEKLQKIISKSGYNIAKSIRNYKLEISLVRDIKEKLCYIAIDVDKEVKTANFCTPSIYKLPDGKEIVLGIERFQCPEGLFQPSLLGKECAGIHTILNESITKCDAVFQKELYSNIVLSGGTTLLPGFVERMRNYLAQHKTDFNITVPRELKHSVWLGGSILACLCNSQKSMWISKQEYDEYGSSIVHSKCF